jgi:hypothetical protein
MFELTSEFGDIYEGHIIRINKEKLVLLLASTYHSHIKFSQCENLENIPDEPVLTMNNFISPIFSSLEINNRTNYSQSCSRIFTNTY